jgi:hypothetical protein
MPPGGTTPDEYDHWPSWGSGGQRARTLGDGAPSYDRLGVCRWEFRIIFKRATGLRSDGVWGRAGELCRRGTSRRTQMPRRVRSDRPRLLIIGEGIGGGGNADSIVQYL